MSSLSKVCVVGLSLVDAADIDFTFALVLIPECRVCEEINALEASASIC